MNDYPLNALRVRDEPRLERDGRAVNYKLATFFLGDQGPFTERFAEGEFTADALNARAEQLRRELQRLMP